MVHLGWVDINTKVQMLDSGLALTLEFCIEALLHVYIYLCENHNKTLAMDTSNSDINRSQYLLYDWKEFSGNVKEAV